MEHNLVLIEKCIPKPEDVSLTVDKYNLELACTILPKYFFDVSAIRIRVDADRKRLDYDTAAQGVFAMTRRVKANDIRPQVAQGLNNIVETCRNTNHKLSSAIRHIVVVHRRLQERGDNQAAIEVSATTSEMKSVLQLAKLDNDALRNAAIQQREDVNTMSVQDLQRLKISVDRDERLVARALEYATEMRYLAKHTIRETTKTIPSKSASAQGMEFAQTQRELVNEVARNVEAVLTQARQHKALLTIFMERTEPAGSATHNPRTLAADRSYYAIAGMARSKGIVSECVERLETSIHSVGILEKQLAIYKDLVDPNDIKHLSQLPQYRHVTNLEWHCRLQTVCRDLRDYFQEGLTAAITASLYIYGPATHRGEGFERVPRNRDIMRMTLDQRHEETRRAVKNVGDLMRDAKLVLQNIAPSREITKLFYLAEYLERESPKALAYLDTSIAKLLDSRKAKRSLASAVSKKKFEAMWASEGQHNLNSCNAVEYAWALNDSARYLRRVAHSLTHMPVRSLAATSTVAEQLPSATEPLDDMAPAAIG